MSANVTLAAFDYIINTYMAHPSYLRLETPSAGRDAQGNVRKCPFFSFYQINYIANKLGSVQATAALLQQFRQKAAANPAVGCIHLNMMGGGLNGLPGSSQQPAVDLGADTVSHYGWMKTVTNTPFPQANYTDVQKAGVSAWQIFEQHFGVPYIPSASVAWDASPRCAYSDVYTTWGYPWGSAWRATPAEWQQSLQLGRQYLDARCSSISRQSNSGDVPAYCPPLILNAWNEWSEGAYLEPDVREGSARLDAVKAVFG